MINLNSTNDISQYENLYLRIFLFHINFLIYSMFFSKSFGYALRGILYIALTCNEKQRVRADEIAQQLAVPKPFLSKIMKKIVKNGILNSTKGPHGGFSLNEKTLSTPLLELILITSADAGFDNCVLRLKKCDAHHPCPLHHKMETHKKELSLLFSGTTVGGLLNTGQADFIKSLSTI